MRQRREEWDAETDDKPGVGESVGRDCCWDESGEGEEDDLFNLVVLSDSFESRCGAYGAESEVEHAILTLRLRYRRSRAP